MPSLTQRELELKKVLKEKPTISKYELKEPRTPLHRRKQVRVSTPDGDMTSREKRELEDLQECTFQPEPNRQRPQKEDEIVARTPDELIKWGREKDDRMAQKRLENANLIDNECRFTPHLEKKSRDLVGSPDAGQERLPAAARQVQGLPAQAGREEDQGAPGRAGAALQAQIQLQLPAYREGAPGCRAARAFPERAPALHSRRPRDADPGPHRDFEAHPHPPQAAQARHLQVLPQEEARRRLEEKQRSEREQVQAQTARRLRDRRRRRPASRRLVSQAPKAHH